MKKSIGKLYRLILALLSPCMLLCSQHAGAQVPVLRISYDTLCTDIFTSGQMDLITEDTIHYDIEIRHRGSNSLMYKKPSLSVKLTDNMGNKLDASLLGMREDNYWVLDGMASDHARARNRASMDLWMEMSRDPWYKKLEPNMVNGYRGQMVLVEVNKKPMGIYHLCERIDRKQLKLKKYNPSKGGIRGLLYKSVTWQATNPFIYSTANPEEMAESWSGYTISYPDWEEGDSITWQPLVEFARYVRTHSYLSIQPDINEYIDMPVYIDYTLLISLLSARDNNGKNIFWSYYDQTVSKKALVSLWDMDHSWGRRYDGSKETTTNESSNTIYTKLMRTSAFRDSLEQRYAELRQQIFTIPHLDSIIGKYLDFYEQTGLDQIEESIWDGVDGLDLNISAERTYIHEWLVERIAYLDSIYHYREYHYPVEGIRATAEIFTEEQKQRCRRINADSTITLIFSPERFDELQDSLIHNVYAYGTITAWKAPIEAYRLPYFSSDSCYYTTLPIRDLERPGDLGNPELFYRVYYSDSVETDTLYAEPIPRDTGMYVVDKRLNTRNGGVLLMWKDDDIDELGTRINNKWDYAGLAEWELTNNEAQARFANFRRVPRTNNLYRSFHPFYPIISDETAAERVHCVALCAEREGIRSAICLSSNQANSEGAKLPCGEDSMVVHIPDYYREMIQQKHVLNVGEASGSGLSYNNTLWFINPDQYRAWMAEVIRFVNDSTTPLPIQMHCSLGADRTGSFSAVIAALCGATWEEVAQDYESTSLTRRLYRHRGLIRYTLRQMLGIDPEYIADLQAAMMEYMVEDGQISREEIERFVERLQDVSMELSIKDHQKEATGAQIILNNRGEVVILKNGVQYNVLGTRL